MVKIDVDSVLGQMKVYAMKVIGVKLYVNRCTAEEGQCGTHAYRMKNVRCRNLLETMSYDVDDVSLDDEFLSSGEIKYADFGVSVSLNEDDAKARLAGLRLGATPEEIEIRSKLHKIYELGNLIYGKQIICVLKDELSGKYRPIVMNISAVNILTYASVPSGTVGEPSGVIFVKASDDIDSVTCRYGDTCFYDLTEAIRAAEAKNKKETEDKIAKEKAIFELNAQLITNIPRCELDNQTIRILLGAGLVTIGDLTKLSKDELSYIYGIGEARHHTIVKFVESKGLRFRNPKYL